MKRIYIVRPGPADVLKLRDEPEPVPHPGEVRIRIAAAGVNYADLLARQGNHPDQPQMPFSPGHEVAGVLEAVAPGAGSLREGDAVFALTRSGGYGEAVCVPHQHVWIRPVDMTAPEAAALPLDYLSAYLMLVTMGSVRAGTRVLIHDAASSVGLAALDICGVLGATASGTASEDTRELLQARGLLHCVDSNEHNFELALRELTGTRGFDVILDPSGGRLGRRNAGVLAPTGRIIYHFNLVTPGRQHGLAASVRRRLPSPRYEPRRLAQQCLGVSGFNLFAVWEDTERVRAAMAEILDWYGRGWLEPRLGDRFPLSEAAKAHRRLHKDPACGKLLLIP